MSTGFGQNTASRMLGRLYVLRWSLYLRRSVKIYIYMIESSVPQVLHMICCLLMPLVTMYKFSVTNVGPVYY